MSSGFESLPPRSGERKKEITENKKKEGNNFRRRRFQRRRQFGDMRGNRRGFGMRSGFGGNRRFRRRGNDLREMRRRRNRRFNERKNENNNNNGNGLPPRNVNRPRRSERSQRSYRRNQDSSLMRDFIQFKKFREEMNRSRGFGGGRSRGVRSGFGNRRRRNFF